MQEAKIYIDKKELKKEENRVWIANYLNDKLGCNINIEKLKAKSYKKNFNG